MRSLAHIPIGAGRKESGDPELVRFGVAFAKGRMPDIESLRLVDETSGEALSADISTLTRWHDGSARWIAVEACVQPPTRLALRLSLECPEQATEGSHTRGARAVADGSRIAITSPDGEHVLIHLQTLIEPAGRTEGVSPFKTRGHAGRLYSRVETFCEDIPSGGGRLDVRLEVISVAGSNRLECELSLHNPARARHPEGHWDLGDANAVMLSHAGMLLSVVEAGTGCLRIVEGGQLRTVSAHTANVGFAQHSSGGAAWDSRTHVNRAGTVALRRRGWTVGGHGNETSSGFRAAVDAALTTPAFTLRATPVEPWRRFPCAITVDAQTVRVDWAAADNPLELQPGERLRQRLRLRVAARGSERTESVDAAIDTSPALPHAPRGDAVERGVLFGRSLFLSDPFDTELASMFLEPAEWEERRERIDEYGWRNHGEVFADHESLYTKGSPLVSHYNNQYDVLLGFTLQHLRGTSVGWARLADDLARHCADVDVYRTVEDRREYNNGLFWHTDHYVDAATATHRTWSRANAPSDETDHGGGPGSEHCYTAGLCLHSLVFGDAESAHTAQLLADWVGGIHEPEPTVLGTFFDLITTQQVRRRVWSPRPGRSIGNCIASLLDVCELTGDPVALARVERTLVRTLGSVRDPHAWPLLDVEQHWSYTILLQALVRYLHLKRDIGQLDMAAMRVRTVLVDYLRWMLEHEAPYLDRPDKLEFANDTWAAQDVRKHGLLLAGAVVDPDRSAAYRNAAEGIAQHVVDRLTGSPERGFTRIQAILMSNVGVGSAATALAPFAFTDAEASAFATSATRPEAVTPPTPLRQLVAALREFPGFAAEKRWLLARMAR